MEVTNENPIKRNPANTPYQKKPRKSLDQQFQVTVYAMAGLNKSQIAKLTKINRETVSRILSQTEIGMKRAEGRSILINAIPALSLRLVNLADGIAKEKGNLDAILAARGSVQPLDALVSRLESLALASFTWQSSTNSRLAG